MAGRALTWSWRGWLVPALVSALAVLEVWYPVPPERLGAWLAVTDARIEGPRWLLTLQVVACCGALLVRRRRPMLAVFAVCAILLSSHLFGWVNQTLGLELALVVVVFAAGRYAARPAAYLAAPLAMSVVIIGAFEPSREWISALVWSLNALWIFALGAAFRREARVRDTLAKASADAARADATDQRLELAREVHDGVSHSLVVAVLQAEVAGLALDRDPAQARRALAQVADAARSALAETRGLVEVLRDPDAPTTTLKSPSWDDVPSLVRRMRESGLPVSFEVTGSPTTMTEQTAATAYRVVQESLTNVLRHAGKVPTTVGVVQSLEGMVIDIQDDGDGTDPVGSEQGHGLAGMQERVSACGGLLTTGPRAGGGFEVRASLPAAGAG
jgi:signal transduction histidine kinase